MKTAISVPDAIFKRAEALAERLRMSRSELYATALAEYVAKHQDARVTERLNAVYAAQPLAADAALRRAAKRTVRRAEW